MKKKFFLHFFAEFRQVAILGNFADFVWVKIMGCFADFEQVKNTSHLQTLDNPRL